MKNFYYSLIAPCFITFLTWCNQIYLRTTLPYDKRAFIFKRRPLSCCARYKTCTNNSSTTKTQYCGEEYQTTSLQLGVNQGVKLSRKFLSQKQLHPIQLILEQRCTPFYLSKEISKVSLTSYVRMGTAGIQLFQFTLSDQSFKGTGQDRKAVWVDQN